MTTQLVYDPEELLADHPYAEPLVVGGRRFHGGFDDQGNYLSPRTLHRLPAIEAWRARLADESGMELIDVAPEFFADFYPNVAQTRYLLTEGVRAPVIETLTHIGTVEGFGSVIRHVEVPDLQSHFVEPIDGTATAHLARGLYEAHARDEAGFDDRGGHQQMWYAARDLAFENPDVGDPLARMMDAFSKGDGAGYALQSMARSLGGKDRVVPVVEPLLETMITRMTGLLLIELLAFNTFAWAQAVLRDNPHIADGEEAAALVGYIRTDEEPHVGYLRTTLAEMRARTFVGTDGERLAGTDVIDACWGYSMRQMFGLGGRRQQRRELFLAQLQAAIEGHRRKNEILRCFHDLESPEPVIEEEPA